MANPVGTCKLCLTVGAELQNSHLIPAGLYKLLLHEGGDSSGGLVLIAPSGTRTTSRQHREYALCKACESRFGKYESWALRHGPRKQAFPLLSQVLTTCPQDFRTHPDLSVRYTDGKIDVDSLVRFASSIFWRASAFAKREINLGPYQEALRSFLVGEEPFPAAMALYVVLRPQNELSMMIRFPQSSRSGSMRMHVFAAPGYSFNLLVGKDLSDAARSACIVRGPGKPIGIGSFLEETIAASAVDSLLEAERVTLDKKRISHLRRKAKL
jgi:hypothetical protein